jgi:hypothetical protein
VSLWPDGPDCVPSHCIKAPFQDLVDTINNIRHVRQTPAAAQCNTAVAGVMIELDAVAKLTGWLAELASTADLPAASDGHSADLSSGQVDQSSALGAAAREAMLPRWKALPRATLAGITDRISTSLSILFKYGAGQQLSSYTAKRALLELVSNSAAMRALTQASLHLALPASGTAPEAQTLGTSAVAPSRFPGLLAVLSRMLLLRSVDGGPNGGSSAEWQAAQEAVAAMLNEELAQCPSLEWLLPESGALRCRLLQLSTLPAAHASQLAEPRQHCLDWQNCGCLPPESCAKLLWSVHKRCVDGLCMPALFNSAALSCERCTDVAWSAHVPCHPHTCHKVQHGWVAGAQPLSRGASPEHPNRLPASCVATTSESATINSIHCPANM